LLLCLASVAEARTLPGVDTIYADYTLFESVGLAPGMFTIGGRGKGAPTFGGVDVRQPGTFVGAGVGGRVVFGLRHGLRLQLEVADIKLGGIVGGKYPFTPSGLVTYAGWSLGIGWQVHLGRATFHSASMAGLDVLGFDVDNVPRTVLAQLDEAAAQRSLAASRTRFRLGQQLGVRVQMTRSLAMFAAGEIDYDLAWHVGAGLSIGANRRD
jgi:hypothetical protein